jgi:hypothetical protein
MTGQSRMGAWVVFYLWVLLGSLAPACSSSETLIPDGDTPTDGDSDTLDGDVPDPCIGAVVDCAPGTCETRDGKPFCICPENYHAERYNCLPDDAPDGDNESIDGDMPVDGDLADGDVDNDNDSDISGCETGNVPNCTGKEDECYPCKIDLPIQGPDENGLFSVDIKGKSVYGLGVWENWIVFMMYFSDAPNVVGTGGLFVFNPISKVAYKISSQNDHGLYPSIRDGVVIWTDVDRGQSEGSEDNTSNINLFLLSSLISKRVTGSATDKHALRYFDPYPYWIDSRDRLSMFGQALFSLDDQGNELRMDTPGISKGAADFSVFGNRIAYCNGSGYMGIIDREKGEEYFLDIPSEVYYRPKPKLWGNKLFYVDNRTVPNGGAVSTECRMSLYQYDLSTNEETLIHLNTDAKDYLIEDVWENWLLFSYYAEDNYVNPSPSLKYCGMLAADGDLFLRYLPTGEEWNITNHYGSQHAASMWGPIVVWHDTRDDVTPTYGYGELYGTDLCKHPELKNRFAECATR